MNTQLREEELSSRMRLRFGLQQCHQSNFSPHPLYKSTHTFKFSFSQRGTLAFATCLSNLTSKGLGNLFHYHSLFSLSLSLSLHHFPLRTFIWDHTIPESVCLSRPRRESHQKWNTSSDVHTHTVMHQHTICLYTHISNPYFHIHSHIEKTIERKKNIDWGSVCFCAYVSVWNVH